MRSRHLAPLGGAALALLMASAAWADADGWYVAGDVGWHMDYSTQAESEFTKPNGITAKWRFQTGQVVDSSTQTIRPSGPENTEFHISNPKGWPVGTYNVTIYADGDSVDSKNFAVKK